MGPDGTELFLAVVLTLPQPHLLLLARPQSGGQAVFRDSRQSKAAPEGSRVCLRSLSPCSHNRHREPMIPRRCVLPENCPRTAGHSHICVCRLCQFCASCCGLPPCSSPLISSSALNRRWRLCWSWGGDKQHHKQEAGMSVNTEHFKT